MSNHFTKLVCATAMATFGLGGAAVLPAHAADNAGMAQPQQQENVQDMRQQFYQTMNSYRQQIDAALAVANPDFQALLNQPDKSFEELRTLAEMRLELLKSTPAAQAVEQQMNEYRATFQAAHAGVLDTPRAPNRPVLTAEQTQALADHRTALQAKELELVTLLKQTSAEFSALAEKTDKTPEDILKMIELRRELIAATPAAQAILDQIKTLVSDFRGTHPFLARMTRPHGPEAVEIARNKLQTMQALNQEINRILCDGSAEYAALLAKDNKTPAEVEQMNQLREQLLVANPNAQKLQEIMHNIRDRMQTGDRRPEWAGKRSGASGATPSGHRPAAPAGGGAGVSAGQ